MSLKACNQDAAIVLGDGESTLHGVAVADGLGSFTHAGEAARFAVERAKDFAQSMEITSAASLGELFRLIRRDLSAYAQQFAAAQPLGEKSFGTTLLIAVETPTHLIAAYVGNGAIWHLRGNFDGSASEGKNPWSAVNYLSPHSESAEGREQLYNIIELSDPAESFPPTMITINKDPHFGDILLLCTDGIYSADQILHGVGVKDDLWIRVEDSMTLFYEALRTHFSQPVERPESPALEDCMRKYLASLKSLLLIEDDATVGLIVTGQALTYLHEHKPSARNR